MEFLHTIKNSAYNPSFYRELMVKPVKSSVAFYIKLAAILTLILTVLFIPGLLFLARLDTYQKIANYYPQDLQIVVNQGLITSNVQEPYYIASPFGSNTAKNLVVIDTKTDFSATQFDTYKTTAIIKKDMIAIRDGNNGQIKITQASQIPNLTLNKQIVNNWTMKLYSWSKYVLLVLVILLMILYFAFYAFKLVYLFFAALGVWLIAIVMKRSMTYMKAYQIALHAMLIPLILELLALISGIRLPIFFFSIILWIIAGLNMRDLPAGPTAVIQPQPNEPIS